MIKEYTNNVPAELRLCDDLNDVRLCYDVMEKTTDSVLLMNFIQFHIFIAGIYSCLLQPKALTNQDQQLLSLVQQHSLSQTLKSCQLLIHGIHRLSIVNMSSCKFSYLVPEIKMPNIIIRQLPCNCKRVLVSCSRCINIIGFIA